MKSKEFEFSNPNDFSKKELDQLTGLSNLFGQKDDVLIFEDFFGSDQNQLLSFKNSLVQEYENYYQRNPKRKGNWLEKVFLGVIQRLEKIEKSVGLDFAEKSKIEAVDKTPNQIDEQQQETKPEIVKEKEFKLLFQNPKNFDSKEYNSLLSLNNTFKTLDDNTILTDYFDGDLNHMKAELDSLVSEYDGYFQRNPNNKDNWLDNVFKTVINRLQLIHSNLSLVPKQQETKQDVFKPIDEKPIDEKPISTGDVQQEINLFPRYNDISQRIYSFIAELKYLESIKTDEKVFKGIMPDDFQPKRIKDKEPVKTSIKTYSINNEESLKSFISLFLTNEKSKKILNNETVDELKGFLDFDITFDQLDSIIKDLISIGIEENKAEIDEKIKSASDFIREQILSIHQEDGRKVTIVNYISKELKGIWFSGKDQQKISQVANSIYDFIKQKELSELKLISNFTFLSIIAFLKEKFISAELTNGGEFKEIFVGYVNENEFTKILEDSFEFISNIEKYMSDPTAAFDEFDRKEIAYKRQKGRYGYI